MSEHDQLIKNLLTDPEKREAASWLRGNRQRTIGYCKTNHESIELVKRIYDMGALEIIAVRIHSNRKSLGERTGKLVVKLPLETTSRRKIFVWCERQGDSLGFTPQSDGGESHLYLLLD